MKIGSFSPIAIASRARFVYVGKANMDAMDNPVPIFYDAEHTRRAPNPFILVNGFNAFRGAESSIFADEEVSILVVDADDIALYEVRSASMFVGSQLIDALLVQLNALLVLKVGDTMTGPLVVGNAIETDEIYSRSQLDVLLDAFSSATFVINSDVALAQFLTDTPGFDFRSVFVLPGGNYSYSISPNPGVPIRLPRTCIKVYSSSVNRGTLNLSNTSGTVVAIYGATSAASDSVLKGIIFDSVVINLRVIAGVFSTPNPVFGAWLPNSILFNCKVAVTVDDNVTVATAYTIRALLMFFSKVVNCQIELTPSNNQLTAPSSILTLTGITVASLSNVNVLNTTLKNNLIKSTKSAAKFTSVVASTNGVYVGVSDDFAYRASDIALAFGTSDLDRLTTVEIDGCIIGDIRKSRLIRSGTARTWVSFAGKLIAPQAGRKSLAVVDKTTATTPEVHLRDGIVSNGPIQMRYAGSVQTVLVNGRIDDSFKVNNSHLKIRGAVAQTIVSNGFGTAAVVITGTDGTWAVLNGTAATVRRTLDDGATFASVVFATAPTDGLMPNRGIAFFWETTKVYRVPHTAGNGFGAPVALPALSANVVGMFCTAAGAYYAFTVDKLWKLDIANNLWIDTGVAIANIVAFQATGDGVIGIVTTTNFWRIDNGDAVSGLIAQNKSALPAGTFKQFRRGAQVDWYYLTTTALHVSHDNGLTWSVLYNAPVNTTFSAFDINEMSDVITVVGQVTTPTLFIANSPDGGTTWNTGTPAGVSAFDVKTDGSGNWYISATDGAPTTIVGKSTDEGVTFGWTTHAATTGGRLIASDGRGAWIIGTASVNIIREILASYQASYFSHDNSVPAANSAAGGWNS